MAGPRVTATNRQVDPIAVTSGALVNDRAAYLRDIDILKKEAQLYMPKIPTYKYESYLKETPYNIRSQYVFRDYKGIRQWGGETVDQLIDRINMLEEQMPPHSEPTRLAVSKKSRTPKFVPAL
ncbi:hypothetical protein MMC22_008231 [Lobaria immixta]|nr:hypothetical protein [Lobaria immixta]